MCEKLAVLAVLVVFSAMFPNNRFNAKPMWLAIKPHMCTDLRNASWPKNKLIGLGILSYVCKTGSFWPFWQF